MKLYQFDHSLKEDANVLFPSNKGKIMGENIKVSKEIQKKELNIKDYCKNQCFNYLPISMGDRAEFMQYLGNDIYQKIEGTQDNEKAVESSKEKKHMETYVALNLIKAVKEKMDEKEMLSEKSTKLLKEHNRRFLKKASSEVHQMIKQFNLDVRKPMISYSP